MSVCIAFIVKTFNQSVHEEIEENALKHLALN